MAEYSVGIATRNRIYEVSKRLFYEKGIRGTSYKDICDTADVNRGLIPYHFKSKDNIAALVLSEFVKSMEGAINSYWPDLSAPVRNILIEYFQFQLLETNENALRFYAEVFGSDALHAATVREEEDVIRQLCEGSGLSIGAEAGATVARMVNGTESELVLALSEGAMKEPVETYVRRDILTCYFLLNADMKLANEWCDEAFDRARGKRMVCNDVFECTLVDA